MKKNLTLLGAALMLGVVFNSCETDENFTEPVSVDLKKAYKGLVKPSDNGVVLKWNEAVSLAVDNRMPVAPEARIYAMVMLAIHDALNSVVPAFETYATDSDGVVNHGITRQNVQGLADVAVSQAAHDVLVALVPATTASAGALLETYLSAVGDSEFKTRAIEAGAQAAAAMLFKRRNDPPLRFHAYPQGTEPGQYRSPGPYAAANPPIWPANAAYAPDMGQLEPFGLISGNQFRAIPPFAVTSPEYAADYNEVKLLGRDGSTERTAEQAEMGLFFIDNVANSINRVLRILAVRYKLDCWDTARLFGLVHMAQFDAVLSSFESMYFYNFWRPETAIRSGDSDGNDATEGDTGWIIPRSARVTPPTPTYPSTHAEAAAAVAEILKLFFNRDHVSFTIGSYTLPGVDRSFDTFSQYVDEVSESRIYMGYQFRNDIVQGKKMGRELARFVFANNLRAL